MTSIGIILFSSYSDPTCDFLDSPVLRRRIKSNTDLTGYLQPGKQTKHNLPGTMA